MHALLQHSTDIRSVQDNVATPVTAMMVTVCISTDALSSVFICPDLSETNSFHQCSWSIMPVTACSCRLQQSVPNIPVSFCYIRLIHPWQPNRLFQSDTVSYDIIPVSGLKVQQAVTGLWRFCVCKWRPPTTEVKGLRPVIEHLIARGKSLSTLCRKLWVFSGSSDLLPQGKLTGWVRINKEWGNLYI